MLSKKEQTRKKKLRDDKKLQKTELRKYQLWLIEKHPNCQAKLHGCEHKAIESHHVLFGCYGADKDDTTMLRVCRSCHQWAHKNKALSQELFLHVAHKNWADYRGLNNEKSIYIL